METNNFGNQAPTEYTLTQEDLKQIEDDANKLTKFIDDHFNFYKYPQLRWSAGSEDYITLCRYQQWLRANFLKDFGDIFHLEQFMSCKSEIATIYVVIQCFPTLITEIVKVSKYIFETAKSMGCYYSGVELDFITDDDPRREYEYK